MNNRQEIRYLEIMQKKLARAEDGSQIVKRLNSAIRLFTLVIFLGCLWYLKAEDLGKLLAMLGMMAAGVIAGIAVSWKNAESQWPALKAHIDPDSVKARLAELRES